jgi:signal transduction histidine kinase
VCLTVRDNGKGFDLGQPGPVTRQGGFGLTGMKQRANLMHGALTIQSQPERGTVVEIRVPTGVTSR